MVERKKEIRRRRKRRSKLKKLKALLAETRDIKRRDQLIEKIRKYEYRFNPED